MCSASKRCFGQRSCRIRSSAPRPSRCVRLRHEPSRLAFFLNPEIELELEDFGGTGEVRGVRASESTFQLSQLIELGGKRTGGFVPPGLERDLAGWDYEAKRLDVLTEATKAFVDVLAAQERLALTEDIVRLSEQVLNAAFER